MTKHTVKEKQIESGRGEFQIVVDNEVRAYMKYSRLDATLILHHTEVHSSMRGTGAGSALLEFAIENARTHNKKIVALCPYARKSLDRRDDISDVYED